MASEWTVYLRDPQLRRVAPIGYSTLSLLLAFNGPSAFDFTVTAADVAAFLVPGAGVIIERDGRPLLSGPLDERRRTWARDADHLILSGPDDTIVLADRVALPVPGGPPYTTATHDVRTGAAETVMRAYVDANAGPGARAERRVAGLRMATDLGRGVSGTWRARFDPLLDTLREIALAGGDLGFRVVQAADATAIEFQVYSTADKTAIAQFSPELGNLAAYDYRSNAPPGTYLYLLGGGEGTARTIVEGGDVAAMVAWRRREQAVDARDLTDPAELARRRDKELAERAGDVGLAVTPIDTRGMAFGVDYGLGDRVTVMVDGQPVREVVREVQITVDEGGETVKPTLLSPGALAPDVARLYAAVRALGARLDRLEHR